MNLSKKSIFNNSDNWNVEKSIPRLKEAAIILEARSKAIDAEHLQNAPTKAYLSRRALVDLLEIQHTNTLKYAPLPIRKGKKIMSRLPTSKMVINYSNIQIRKEDIIYLQQFELLDNSIITTTAIGKMISNDNTNRLRKEVINFGVIELGRKLIKLYNEYKINRIISGGFRNLTMALESNTQSPPWKKKTKVIAKIASPYSYSEMMNNDLETIVDDEDGNEIEKPPF